MRKLPWEVTLFLGVIGLFILIVSAKNYIYNSYLPHLKLNIEKSLAERFHARVRSEVFDITPTFPILFPLTLFVQGVHIERDFEYSLKIKKMTCEIKLNWSFFQNKKWKPEIKIEISEADIQYDTEAAARSANPGDISPLNLPKTLRDLNPSPKQLSDLAINLEIKNLKIRITKKQIPLLQFQQMHVLGALTSLDQPIFVSFATQLLANNAMVPFWLPVSIQSQINWQNSSLQFVSADIKLLGLTSRSQGEINLTTGKIKIESRVEAKELSQIPITLKDLPIRKWSGAINLGISASGSLQNPQIHGVAALSKANLSLAIHQPQFKITGPISGDINANFAWNGELKIPSLEWNVNLQETEVQYSNLFLKPSGFNLKSSGKMTLEKNLQLENIKAELGAMQVQASGTYRSQGESDLTLKIPVTNLNGMEKLLTPIARYPLNGKLALQASLKGPLNDNKLIRIDIPQIKLENLSTTFNYKNEDLSINGPLRMNLNGHLSLQGIEVRSGGFDLDGDFSGLQMQFKDLFKKSQGELAKLSLKATQQGSKIQLRSSQLQIPAGVLEFSGEPPLYPTANFRVAIESNSVDTAKLLRWFPKYEKAVPKAMLRTHLEFSGAMNPDSLMKSDIHTKGNLDAKIPQLILPKPSVSEKPTASATEAHPKALLEDNPFLRGVDIQTKIEIGEFSMPPYEAQGIAMNLNVKGLKLSAIGSVQKIFGGSLNIKSLNLPLNEVTPIVNFSMSASGIRFEKLTASMMPQFEKLIQAQTHAEVSGTSPWPTSKNFLTGINANGKLQISNGVLNTMELANILKDLIAKIPKGKPEWITQRGPLQITESLLNFKMQNGKIDLNPFVAKTARQDELNVSGYLDLMMNVNLNGSLALSDGVQNLGSVYEANKDSRGRLVLPIEIKGNALTPEAKIAQDMIAKMLARAVEYEKNNVIGSAKKQVSTALEKKKSELGDEIKKKVQNLFR